MGKKRSGTRPKMNDESASSDEGGAAAQSRHQCHHAKKAVSVDRVRRALKRDDSARCASCSASGARAEHELWICLLCGERACGPRDGDHALAHYETPRSECHALAVDTAAWLVRCHSCGRDVQPSANHPHHRKLKECVDQLRRMTTNNDGDGNCDSNDRQSSPPARPSNAERFAVAACSSRFSGNATGRRVRGLFNLGNTCYFNSVLQCLAQTPFLHGVLADGLRSGEKIRLPGGRVKLRRPKPKEDAEANGEEEGEEKCKPEEPTTKEEDEEFEEELQPMRGELPEGENLTRALSETLQEIRAPDRCDVFSPLKLLQEFVKKVPQFDGGDQHDSHELLRHLLEAVRSEDLRRYQTVVLQNLGYDCKAKRKSIDDVTRQKIKFYGQQASDSMLRPGQVFRGLLVSTLECQECKHSSSTTEYFLDLSLPVTADKPQPPAVTRRKMLDEQASNNTEDDKPKNQSGKQGKRAVNMSKILRPSNKQLIKWEDQSGDGYDNKSENKSSSEQSDADVEDNVEDNHKPQEPVDYDSQRDNNPSYCIESGYNSEKIERASPIDSENKEKCDVSPERTDKDIEDNKCSNAVIALPYKSLAVIESPQVSNPDSGVASPETAKHALSDTNVESPITSKEIGSPTSLSSEINMDMSSPRQSNNSPTLQQDSDMIGINEATYGNTMKTTSLCPEPAPSLYVDELYKNFEFDLKKKDSNGVVENERTTSPVLELKWKKDTSPFTNRSIPNNTSLSQRNICDEGEYSIQSCLNQFTSSELLTGNNKIGCESCSKGSNKTVYTNATKRFCISSPPAVLILHLKRFQLGSRCVLRKITKTVNFPVVLDLAPFCSEKAKSTNPNKMLYSLYGVVEHSGNTLHLGHYVAYVKVRPELSANDTRWKFLPPNIHKDEGHDAKIPEMNGTCNSNDNDTDSSLSGYESGEGVVGCSDVEPPTGKWYSVSDSRVMEVLEEEVLKVQAYLLFYERIL